MSKGNTYEADIQKLLYQAVAIANIADNAATAPLTSLYVSLHTADPGEAGDQSTSEASYPGYARVAVVRSAAGWSIAADVITNAALVTFPQCTSGGPQSLTHFVVGTLSSGAGKQCHRGALTATLIVNPGIYPEFPIGSLSSSED